MAKTPQEIIIEDFARMTPETPEYIEGKNEHFLLQNVNPLYYLNNNSIQEEQAFPLAASISLGGVSSGSGLTGNIVQIIPSPQLGTNVFTITDQCNVYAFDAYANLGNPWTSAFDAGGQLEIYNGKLIATRASSPTVYYQDIVTRPGWSALSSTVQAPVGKHYLKSFLDFCAIADGDSGFSYSRYVKKITSSLTITNGIDLGAGWGTLGFENYNNKYLAIAAGYFGGFNLNTNYLFLWDGIRVGSYNYAIQMPGQFVDMKCILNTLYVLVQEGPNAFGLYYLNGFAFKKVLSLPGASVVTGISLAYNNWIAINITAGLYTGLLIFDPVSQARFIIDARANFAAMAPGLYASSANSILSTNVNGGYSNINYLSHYIYLPESSGQFASVKIYYDTPPVFANDKISTTLYLDSEDVATIGSGPNSTINLNDITPTTYDTPKKTVLDPKGAVANRFKIGITTQWQGGSSWKPIIRAIKIKIE